MEAANEDISLPDFFVRNGLDRDDFERCLTVARERFTDRRLVVLSTQGGCSFTVAMMEEEEKGLGRVIVQFRLKRYALERVVAVDAWSVYGDLVPRPLFFDEEEKDLQVVGMSGMKGLGFGSVQPRQSKLSENEVWRLGNLLDGLARFFALGWQAAVQGRECDGKVGRSMRERLVMMEQDLPSAWLRSRAKKLRKVVDVGELDLLPVVLNHGDFLPTNILVDEQMWTLEGLVDWAEAEYLPFGMTMYGIEHLLGYMVCRDGQHELVYYQQAAALRDRFWQQLRALLPGLNDDRTWSAMMVCREIGIFLWHSIAWDDGKLNRVVNEVDDAEEMAYLEAFLTGEEEEDRQTSRL